MTFFFQTDSAPIQSWAKGAKHFALASAAAFALAACNSGSDGASKTKAAAGSAGKYEVTGDHAIGNPDASVVVVEHASVVCGACANWHNTVYPDFKKKYIDSGKVRFIFREFPTSPENLAQAGFLIANCANEDKFFDNISLQFKRQNQIFEAARNGKVLDEYISIAKTAGLSEADFEACLVNEEEIAKYKAVVKAGIDAGVAGTPHFFINGKTEKIFTMEQFDEVLAPLLGEPLPEKADKTMEDSAAEATEESAEQ